MKKVLFVCLGNVGRSQMAEAFYNHFTNSTDAWSAGIQKDTPLKYPNPTSKIIDAMGEYNIDVSQAKVKTVTQDIVDNSEKIIILCKKEECPNFLLTSQNIIFWDIEDPFEVSFDNTRKIRDQIKEKVLTLII